MGVITQAKDVYFDYIMKILNNVQIPDIRFEGGHLKRNTFSIT